ncbi:YesL family protein [Lactovum odontotermitis]
MPKLATGSMRIGEIIIFVGKLQLLWFAILFRYLVIGGIFPATAAVIDFLSQSFKDSSDGDGSSNGKKKLLTYRNFQTSAKENFKRANQVGYIALAVLAFLYVDLRLAIVFTKNVYVTVCLAALLVIIAASFLYLIPAIVRYELSLKDSFRQAFFLLLANIPNTIAMLIGMALAGVAGFFIPVLVLLPVPLFLLANAWFSYQGMRKLERANEKS